MTFNLELLSVLGQAAVTICITLYGIGIRYVYRVQKKSLDFERCKLENTQERVGESVAELKAIESSLKESVTTLTKQHSDLLFHKKNIELFLETADGKKQLAETNKTYNDLLIQISDLKKRFKGEIIASAMGYKGQECSQVISVFAKEVEVILTKYPDLLLEIVKVMASDKTKKEIIWLGSTKESFDQFLIHNKNYVWNNRISLSLRIKK